MIIGNPIPTWRQCADRKADGMELNALEQHILDYEPVGAPMVVVQWRNSLSLAIKVAVTEAQSAK